MKPLIIFCVLVACSCNSQDTLPGTIAVSVIEDCTDPFILHSSPNHILRLFEYSDVNVEGSSLFRLTHITDKQVVPFHEIRLGSKQETAKQNKEQTPKYREKEIVKFYDLVRGSLTASTTPTQSSMANSECFRTISGELVALTRTVARKKYLIVFSDLQEHSDILNCYCPQTQNWLNKRPNEVVTLLNSYDLLPEKLSGVTVYFIYAPPTREADIMYVKMVAVYKQLLEKRGARVYQQANNTNLIYE